MDFVPLSGNVCARRQQKGQGLPAGVEMIVLPGDYLIEILNADSTAVQPYVLELHRSPAN